MTITEFMLCLISFGVVNLIWYRYKGRSLTKANKVHRVLFFLPGLFGANIVSWIVSHPQESLAVYATDMPTLVGFPLSFYEIGGWGSGDDQMHWLALVMNISLSVVLGIWYAVKDERFVYWKYPRRYGLDKGMLSYTQPRAKPG